ncbi:MAG: alpha/beta hydrolase family esterase [bacterium]
MSKSATLSGLLFALLLLPISANNPLQAHPADQKYSLRVGGRERSYVLHIPPTYDGKNPAALVIVLHGGGGNARNAMKMTEMNDKSDAEGFLVVYPNGSGRLRRALLTWNAKICCGYAMDRDIDDVGFIRKMISELQRKYNIDPGRIYATGISNGGMMAYRLACELSDKIAAIAPVAASLPIRQCRPEHPLSVLIFHGTNDRNILYKGGKPKRQFDRHSRNDLPVAEAVSFWVQHNHCSTSPERLERPYFTRETYTGGRNGTEVVLYTIQGGGHAWPGGKKGVFWGDKPATALSATDVMWKFFLRHPKTDVGEREFP